MSDRESSLDLDQGAVKDFVERKFHEITNSLVVIKTSPKEVHKLITSLKRGVCPGIDNICVEHLTYGISDALCDVLADLYSSILSTTPVPDCMSTGVIIPILKKSTLDANNTGNYRPITLSSTFSRLLELLISPDYTPCDMVFALVGGPHL
jgi:hypothetical protein